MASGSPSATLAIQGLWSGGWQVLQTVASMLGVITAVLAGSSAVLAGSSAALGAAAASAALVAALASGVIVGLAVLAALVRYQFSASDRAKEAAPFEENQDC